MDTQPLIDFLLQFGDLNKQQTDLIKASVTERTYKAGDYFMEAGQVAREIAFTLDGIFRVCYYDNNGNEVTRYFLEEGTFMADMESYNCQLPSTSYVQSVTDSKILILSKAVMDNLSQTIIIWDNIIHKITTKGMAQKVQRLSSMFPQDATERYLSFLEKFPNLANRVPLQYIASYLGITKHSLSRIRKNIR
ncbi:Crp/Fnr family transcriptional regulator [Flavobacterium alkalisoli]|uniref:Crp/Fnr family transcriptional regulator n=1 Tax=Flavobacterium alkalisoli TaxID=2602769 RepID=A0A5B9FRW1_9FLAO|nr:Crp/Fnr family transcriptional regulator [Flavobacterium alkalisoli]QEE50103.1 Crp/Fnr family transcriptional regulator [Flavobacterium alkalisoli]